MWFNYGVYNYRVVRVILNEASLSSGTDRTLETLCITFDEKSKKRMSV